MVKKFPCRATLPITLIVAQLWLACASAKPDAEMKSLVRPFFAEHCAGWLGTFFHFFVDQKREVLPH
ncbi:MAG: hypothetical protein ACI9UA_004073 [Pseudoalteromonas tetraodonis]|jgi:hypothetical protein